MRKAKKNKIQYIVLKKKPLKSFPKEARLYTEERRKM